MESPDDGRWYRAEVFAATGTSFDIAWLMPPPAAEGAALDEYRTLGSSPTSSMSNFSAAVVVPGDAGRPVPASLAGEAAWSRQLCAVEGLTRILGELRTCLGELQGGAAGMPSREAAGAEGALCATAGSLEVLRKESERRAEVLRSATAECVLAGRCCEQRLDEGGKDLAVELANLEEEEGSLRSRAAQLQEERSALLAKVWALDEELASVSAALEKSEQRKHALREGAEKAADELRWELTTGEEAGRSVAEQRRMLIELGAVSRDVEALLSMRAKEASAVGTRCGGLVMTLAGRSMLASEVALEVDGLRWRCLEGPLASFRAARRSADAAALRGAQTRALELLHEAVGCDEAPCASAAVSGQDVAPPDTAQPLPAVPAGGVADDALRRHRPRYEQMRRELETCLAAPTSGGERPGGQAPHGVGPQPQSAAIEANA